VPRKLVVSTSFALLFFFIPVFGTDTRTEIYGLRHHTHPYFTRIVIDIGSLREYNFSELRSPDRIYVDIYQAKLNPILQGQTIPVSNDYLNQIRIAQKTPSTVRAVVELDFEKIKHYEVFNLFDPFRVVIDIYPKEASVGSSSVPPQPPKPTSSGYSMIRQLGLGIQTIVIDPGHGGGDPGCMGKGGLKEKDVALDVSLALKKLLGSKKDLEVILTRETDIFVPLENRTVIANQKRADIFLSIHANSNFNKKRRGVETFYLNFSPDPQVNETAALENATSTKNISEMRETLKKIVQNSKIVESKELAENIQKNLVKCLSKNYEEIKNLGVKGGPFWVLIGGEMPSVLIEISHLSNSKDAMKMRDPLYRQQIAQGIYEGIMEYIQSLGKG